MHHERKKIFTFSFDRFLHIYRSSLAYSCMNASAANRSLNVYAKST